MNRYDAQSYTIFKISQRKWAKVYNIISRGTQVLSLSKFSIPFFYPIIFSTNRRNFQPTEPTVENPFWKPFSPRLKKWSIVQKCPLPRSSSISPILIAVPGARSRQIHAYFRAGCEQWRPVGSVGLSGKRKPVWFIVGKALRAFLGSVL